MIAALPSREIRPSEHSSALGGLTSNTEARGFPVGACAPPTGLPVLHPLPCAYMPSPLPRRRRPVLRSTNSLGLPGRWQPSP